MGPKVKLIQLLISGKFTFLGMPIKERDGASDGGKVCSYKGPTLLSSITTIPLVSRKGNA